MIRLRRRSELLLPVPQGGGRAFTWDARDPQGLARAHREAAAFRADSVRSLRVPKMLRALSWQEILDGIHAGRIEILENGMLFPCARGGGAEPLFSVTPSSSNAPATVATTTARKSLIQVATPSTVQVDVCQWGIWFDASAAAQPIVVDLTEVDVAATVTSFTPIKWADPNVQASLCVGGTSATGTNATAEGTITASRIFDAFQVPPITGLLVQYPLGREPKVAVSKFLRLRALGFTSDTPNALPSLLWRE